MELRPLPFLADPRYRISRDGTVWTREMKRGRSRAAPSVRWELVTPISRADATSNARGRGDSRLELIRQSSHIRWVFDREGRVVVESVVPYQAAGRVSHSGDVPTEVRKIDVQAIPGADLSTFKEGDDEVRSSWEWGGGEVPLVGSGEDRWYCVSTEAGGRVHIFHGPSEAAEIFKG